MMFHRKFEGTSNEGRGMFERAFENWLNRL